MTELSEINWLHISDLHLKGGDSFDRDIVLESFMDSILQLSDRSGKPDLVLFSGDLAFSGTASEYDKVSVFFDELLDIFGLSKNELFVVPGNHDVNRNNGKGLIRSLEPAESDSYFEPSVDLPHLRERQREFIDWHDNYFDESRKFETTSTIGQIQTFTKGGLSIGILLINTAAFCFDDNDNGKLWVGKRCFSDRLKDFDPNDYDLALGIGHHPLSWVNEHEQSQIEALIEEKLDVYLRGHVHRTYAKAISSEEGRMFELAAGALYQTTKWPNKALFCKLTKNQLKVLPIQFSEAPKPKWTVDPSMFSDRKDYSGSFAIRSERLKPSANDRSSDVELVGVDESDVLANMGSSGKHNGHSHLQGPDKHRSNSKAAKTEHLKINGYKLFHFRHHKKISKAYLARLAGMNSRRLSTLEKVNRDIPSGPDCFKSCSLDELRGLEKALNVVGQLEVGQPDDFLADFQVYYDQNYGKKRGQFAAVESPVSHRSETHAVVFDFGGTLSNPTHDYNTWERIWKSVGYSIAEVGEPHRKFIKGEISHTEWCDITCEKLREREFSLDHFNEIRHSITPIEGLSETFKELHSRNIGIYIVSGSIREIIDHTLGESSKLISRITCNRFLFDKGGIIRDIKGHDFDFEGKAEFINQVIQENRCNATNVLFVGNSLNDLKASLSGARTLCVNPKRCDPYDTKAWTNAILEMKSLEQILEYV